MLGIYALTNSRQVKWAYLRLHEQLPRPTAQEVEDDAHQLALCVPRDQPAIRAGFSAGCRPSPTGQNPHFHVNSGAPHGRGHPSLAQAILGLDHPVTPLHLPLFARIHATQTRHTAQ